MRATLDPNALVSAVITSSGPNASIMLELAAGGFELILSPYLLGELSEVLTRDKFARYVSASEIRAYLGFLESSGIVIDDEVVPGTPVVEDPGDQYLVDLFFTGRADLLVSGDAHLLKLARILPVVTPREFLRVLGARGG